MAFPEYVTMTVTNLCNRRCSNCGLWNEHGYMHKMRHQLNHELPLKNWFEIIDEISQEEVAKVMVRGGEPFLYPGIIELLKYLKHKQIRVTIRTNGSLIGKYASDIVELDNVHLLISVNGPSEVHDNVRGVYGCFSHLHEGLQKLKNLEQEHHRRIGKSIYFTISSDSVKGMGDMAKVARELGISEVIFSPISWVDSEVGRKHELILRSDLGCQAYAWTGFARKVSGIDFDGLLNQYAQYEQNSDGILTLPVCDMSKDEYQTWYRNAYTPVGNSECNNIEHLIDIQPNGFVNFCVDFPDIVIGDIKKASIKEIWNSYRANKFREFRKHNMLPICQRCTAKYITNIFH